jgi:hypothetical protein
MSAFGSQELALDVKEGIRLVGFAHGVVNDLYRFHLFVFKEFR